MLIFAIDPGTTKSGYAVFNMPDFKLNEFGKIENEKLLEKLTAWDTPANVFIEMVSSYGKPVGREVFRTCVWIGVFERECTCNGFFKSVKEITRKDVKTALGANIRATDADIRHMLIRKYAKFDFKTGKGVKNNPDVFYGVSADVWQAIAAGVAGFFTEAGK